MRQRDHADRIGQSSPVRTPMTVAIAGVGSFAQRVLIPGLVALPHVTLLGVYGPTPARTSAVAHAFPGVHPFGHFLQMLDTLSPDAVIIATPNDVHCEMVLEACSRRLAVLCEKPLGVTVTQAKTMVEASRVAGVPTAVNFTYRSTTSFRHLRALVDIGAIGSLRHFTVVFHQSIRADAHAPIGFRMLRERGGGAMMDIGIHMVDAVRWICGEIGAVAGINSIAVPSRPGADGFGSFEVTADDTSSSVVRLKNGATGTVQVSQVAHGRSGYRRIELFGQDATLVLEEERGEPSVIRCSDRTSGRLERVETPVHLDTPFEEFPRVHMGRIMDHLQGLPPENAWAPWPDFAEALRAQIIVEAIERSHLEGTWIATTSEA